MSRSLLRQIARFGAAASVAATVALTSTGTAHALRIDPVIGGGIDPILVIDNPGGATGSVDLDGCNANASNVRVMLVNGGTMVRAAVTANGGGRFTYTASGLRAGTWNVSASLENRDCAFGRWTVGLASVAVRESVMEAGPAMAYDMPSKLTRISSSDIAVAVRGVAGAPGMRLHNLGTRVGASRLAANASSVTFAGASTSFTTPEGWYDVDACGVCPDLGDARYYVRNMNSTGATFGVGGNGTVTVGMTFATATMKGYFTPTGTSWSTDSAMPDFEIADAAVSTSLRPVLLNGKVTLVPTGTADFSATVNRLAVTCDPFPGIDMCDAILNYRDRIGTAAKRGLVAGLRTATAATAIQQAVNHLVHSRGVVAPTGLFIDGNDIVIAE